uniref:DNA-directed RNA polymerase n=1 Tax=viral metagenome TaxID=1070528 RepID=A0A6C0IBD3_9ZZZZ
MHCAQSIVTETEIRHLAATPYQIINPGSNKPIIGIFQDSLLGSFRFTRKDIKFSPRDAMNLLMSYPHVDVNAIRKAGKEVTNFDILSQITPPITLKYKTGLFDEDTDDAKDPENNNMLEIYAGKYIRGQVEKSVFEAATKGILHRICNDFGNMACADYNDNLQNIVTEYMKTSSFSVGISDLIADRATNEKIVEAIRLQKMEVQTIIDKVHLGIFENNTATSNMKHFELMLSNILNKATEESGKIGKKSLSKDNRFLMIVNSGSKGNLVNISQMISCLGQQAVDGKRIAYGFDDRTLPHYKKYDDSPNSRGFVENSYITGLTAPELFFHAMAGRTGLIDTAVKTSSTGYIQRRLVKGLEDLMINYDMTVRNNKGKIIQFTYGDDNFDSMKVENQILPMANLSVEDIYMHFDIPGMVEAENNLRLAIFTKEAISRMNKQKEKCRDKCYEYATRLVRDRDLIVEKVFLRQSENSVRLPVAFQYLIQNVQGQLDLKGNSAVDITPFEAFELIEEYFERVNSIPFAKTNPLFRVLYFYYLTPRDLLVKRRFHKKALILLLETVLLKFKEALVHPGEMVGVVAATSTGEPCTQLTLNTFHGSGIASKSNVTRGVPRIEEILRLTKNPKNPSMTIYLKPMDETDQDKASQFATRISHTKLIDVVKSVQVCFDPNPTATHIADDQQFLEQFFEFEKMIEDCMETNPATNPPSRSKWIIRIEMDQESLIDKNIMMDDIHFAISNSEYGKDVQCIFSDHNMDKLVFRIRTNGSVFDKSKKTRGVSNPLDQSDEIYLLKNFQDTLLNNIVLRGVNGVHNILPRKIQNSVVKESDKYVKKDTWVLDTTGSNLMETLALDYIDFRRTISNDIKEVFHVLGIEAARQCIQNELIEVLAFSGASVNYHHTSLLCDRMTCNKNMVSIFRSGLLNDNVGPIAKATFEVHTEVFLNAARHAELDHMRGVSANIMCGQHGSYGTNASQIILDMKAFENIKSNKYQRKDVSEEIERGMAQVNDTPITCSKIEIQNNIVNIRHTNDNSIACYDDGYNAGF